MYFNATVQISQENKNGKITKNNEYYLLDAVSYTDAEAKITKQFFGVTLDWEITNLKKSNIIEILK